MLAAVTEPQIIMQALQVFGGLVLLMTTGIASWTMKEVVRQRGEMEALKARVETEIKCSDRRVEALTDWLKAISTKLDTMMMSCPRVGPGNLCAPRSENPHEPR